MVMTTHKFEYVMSAAAHTRITISSGIVGEARDRIKKVIDTAESMFVNHQYTTLYNAFTESQLGNSMYTAGYLPHPMHSDSGGLQIITRGLTADNDIKRKVYKEQANYSGFAMCFDEIPVETVGQSRIGNLSNRVFRPDWIDAKAKETCKNIVAQAALFQKLGSNTKIMLIVQGNCYETYMRWIDACVRYLPKEVYPFIGGMSFAGTSSGSGELEDIERIFSFGICEVPPEWKTGLHLLGVGSIRRLLPLVGFIHSGLINNIKISYDSTTHSAGMSYRRFNDINNKVIACGVEDRRGMQMLYDYTKDYFNIESDYDTFFDTIFYNRDGFVKKYGADKIHLFHETMIAACMVSILHTTNTLDALAGDKNIYDLAAGKQCDPMRGLINIVDKEDYNRYIKEYGRYLDSSRIKKSGESVMLDLDVSLPTTFLPKPAKNKATEKSSVESFFV